jgi:Legionella pneumophila major outer membrane protein precursor
MRKRMSLRYYLKAKNDQTGLKNHFFKMICTTCSLFCLQGFSSLHGQGYQPNQVYQPLSYSEASTREEPSSQFFVRGDFLYWKPQISSLELSFGTGSIVQNTTDVVQVFTMQELDLDPHFKWNPGYRVAAGYVFPCSSWEIGALWTHFQSSGRRTADGVDGIVNSGTTRVNFNQVDVLLSYNSSWCSFTFKPFLGVRLAKINENVNAEVTHDITILPDTFGTITRFFDDHQHSKMIGPLFGFQGDWEVGCGFGIYGTAAASVLYGYHKVSLDDSEIFTVPLAREVFSADSKNLHRFNWNIDLALGVRWDTSFCDSYELGVKVGFEHHEYFNHSLIGVERGDLSFDGAVVSVILGF